MEKKEKQTAGTAGVQVFELTMDNPEDQNDLNRRLQKPGEPNNSPSGVLGRKKDNESATASAEKNGRTNG